MLVFTSAIVGAISHLQKIWVTYETNLTRTTIVSTYFKYANIPFPSVTVCDSSRMDWKQLDNLWVANFQLYGIGYVIFLKAILFRFPKEYERIRGQMEWRETVVE